MASTIGDLAIRIKVDGADAVETKFRNIGRVTGELKNALGEVNQAVKSAQAAGDPIKVEALKASGREIEQAIGKLGSSSRRAWP